MLRGKWKSVSSQWKAQGQCSKGYSCSFSHDLFLASGNRSSGNSERRKGRSSSPASRAKAKQTDGEEQKPHRDQAMNRKTRKTRMKFHADSDSVKIRHVGSGTLPCV